MCSTEYYGSGNFSAFLTTADKNGSQPRSGIKFTSTLFKGWQGSRGQRHLVALRRERNPQKHSITHCSVKSVKVANHKAQFTPESEPSKVSYNTKPVEPTKCELRLFLSRTNKVTLAGKCKERSDEHFPATRQSMAAFLLQSALVTNIPNAARCIC